MMKGKGWIILIVLLLIPLFTEGCWNRRELNKLGIVSAIGIDVGEDQKITYTVQIVKTSALKSSSEGISGSSDASYVMTSSGDTVFDAVRNLVTQSGRKLYYPHNIVIVLGGDMAKKGVQPVLDLFSRDQEMRLLTWVVVTNGKAADIVKADSPVENISARHLDSLLKDYGVASKAVAVHLLDFENEMLDESLQPVVGRVELDESDDKSFVLKGAGVFRKDKLIGWLDPLSSRGYLWIQDKVKSGIINVPDPEQENQLISLEIKKAGRKIKPYVENGKVKYRIEINVESVVGEETGTADLTNPEVMAAIEDEQSTAVEKEVNQIINDAQGKFKVDILGLGDETARKLPQEWKEMKEGWEDIFPDVEVEVTVKSRITNFGLKT
ncbi:Ger(x)C family spore germination protein [Desulfosporosinus sp. SB140]|uniref:Ger(x)C family spore germination protein n=1 Tax=Desulfosporosinus paludis TaxID=3115649 RepID=UPI00388DF2B1